MQTAGLALLLATTTISAGINWLWTPPQIPFSPKGEVKVEAKAADEALIQAETTLGEVHTPQKVAQEAPVASFKPRFYTSTYDGTIKHYASLYGVSSEFLSCIIFHESGFRPEVKNKNSSATGLGQFISSTWVSFRKRMGEDTDLELRKNPEESIKTLSWALSKGYKNHWLVVQNKLCEE